MKLINNFHKSAKRITTYFAQYLQAGLKWLVPNHPKRTNYHRLIPLMLHHHRDCSVSCPQMVGRVKLSVGCDLAPWILQLLSATLYNSKLFLHLRQVLFLSFFFQSFRTSVFNSDLGLAQSTSRCSKKSESAQINECCWGQARHYLYQESCLQY